MKVLIWFLALLANSLVVTSLQMFCGVSLGAIPTVIIFLLLTVLPARYFCKKWDARKKQKKELETLVDSQEETAKAEYENTVHSEKEVAEPKSVPRKGIYTQLPRWRRPVAWLVTFVVWMLMESLIRLLITLCGSAIIYLESLSTVAVVVIVLIFGSLAVGILLMPLVYGPLLIAQLSESIYPSRSGSRFLVIAGLSLLGSLIGFILGFSSYMVFGSGVAKVTWFVSYGYCFICAVILFIFGAKHEEAEKIKPVAEDFSVTAEPVDPEYGTVAHRPIYVCGVKGEQQYLDALQTVSGQKLRYDRWGSLLVEGIDRPVDIYHLFLPSGEQYKTLYLYMYADKNDETVPVGFISSNQKANTSKPEKPKTKIPEILAVVFGILLIGSIGVNSWQYIVYSAEKEQLVTGYNELFSNYETTVADYDAQIAGLNEELVSMTRKRDLLSTHFDLMSDAYFKIKKMYEDIDWEFRVLYNNVVCVCEGEKVYHKMQCPEFEWKTGSWFSPSGKLDMTYADDPLGFYVFDEYSAKTRGYRQCDLCKNFEAMKKSIQINGTWEQFTTISK